MTIPPQYKILHVCKVYFPVMGGVQKVVSLVTSLLPQFSHHVLTTGEDGAILEQEIDGVAISRCRSYGQIASMPIAPSLIFRMVRLFKRQDLIAIHYPFPLAEIALVFCFKSVPVVVHWHSNIVAQRKLRWIVAPFTLLMLLRAKSVVVSSTAMIDNSTMLKAFRKKTQIIPYGIAEAKASMQSSDACDAYFVLIPRHVSYKGIDVAIRSIRNTAHKLVLVGDGPLLERHKQLAIDMGLANSVRFVCDASDQDVVDLLQYSIALVSASNANNEAFALVQLEAMRLGKPIINTQLKSSAPWVARHNKEAITVIPNDTMSLLNAMDLLSKDSEIARRLGEGGLRRYYDLFSVEKFAQKSHDLYRSIIEQASR